VFSSRKLERATYNSVTFRFIAANDVRFVGIDQTMKAGPDERPVERLSPSAKIQGRSSRA
jgi:hypothetical protein